MIRIGIVGGTGYTGVELLRLLVAHPDADVAVITSRSEAGRPVSELFPNLRGHLDIPFSQPDMAHHAYRTVSGIPFWQVMLVVMLALIALLALALACVSVVML